MRESEDERDRERHDQDGRTVVIETAIDIARPAEAVFAYCSDHTSEIEWNPAMRG